MVASRKVKQASGLPRQFPIGTKLVIEDHGSGGTHCYARYVVFPDGRRMDIPAPAPVTKRRRRPARR